MRICLKIVKVTWEEVLLNDNKKNKDEWSLAYSMSFHKIFI